MAALDRITAGTANSTSDAAAQATGSQATSTSNNLSLAGPTPFVGMPIIDFASSTAKANASGGATAVAQGSGSVLVRETDASNVGAVASANVNAQGPQAQATASLNLTAITTANGTKVVFGTVSAVGCCVPNVDKTANLTVNASGRYTYSRQIERLNTNPMTRNTTIDFSSVSSSLPIFAPEAAALVTSVDF